MSKLRDIIIVSRLETVLETLKRDKVHTIIRELGKVPVFKVVEQSGIEVSVPVSLPVCSLEYGDQILLEKVVRDADGVGKDMLVSQVFEKGKQPKDWTIEDKEDAEVLDLWEELDSFAYENPELVGADKELLPN